jgi:mono/diheme cytochrome c family protein
VAGRAAWFTLGFIGAIVALALGAYVFIRAGGMPMGTSSPPLPLEQPIAQLALTASYGNAAQQKIPLPVDEVNLRAGARTYTENCAVCHGMPHMPPTPIAKGMFPPPPQLFEKPPTTEGITFWKVTNGIRMTGMPAFQNALSDTERWQVTMMLRHADRLPAGALASLTP